MFHTYSRSNADREPRNRWFAIWMWVLLCTLVGPAFQLVHGQASAGITGAVTDPSGAAIPAARLTFTNVATGITSRAATSSMGLYSAPLSPGTYTVTVEAPGFQKSQ